MFECVSVKDHVSKPGRRPRRKAVTNERGSPDVADSWRDTDIDIYIYTSVSHCNKVAQIAQNISME